MKADGAQPSSRNRTCQAALEVRFDPIAPSGVLGVVSNPLVQLIGFVCAVGFVTYLLFMRKTLRHLDPSAVIPARVRATLDALAEGVMIVDRADRIVLVNSAFSEKVGRSSAALLGKRGSDLDWRVPMTEGKAYAHPWQLAIRDGEAHTGTPLAYGNSPEGPRTLMVNSSPIIDDDGRIRGALATFDGVTELEEKSDQLERALNVLEKSQEEVRLQNEELQVLATIDPLTGCLNRRCFYENSGAAFEKAQLNGSALSVVMCDIDEFKSVNDRYGHQTGDEVIRMAAEALLSVHGQKNVVCRYGGEEFCMLLEGADGDEASTRAERAREEILSACEEYGVTASFGVATKDPGTSSLAELIHRADSALYHSKDLGRNRVTRFDEMI